MTKAKILIVEDESIVALDIKHALQTLGFKVTDCVRNYTRAIKSVKEARPDIILMDINLDRSKDGIETAKEIQKIENIPIIYLTAFSDEKTIHRAIKTNPISYLIKPFKRDELNSSILLGLYKINKSNEKIISSKCVELGFNYYYDLEDEILFYDNVPIKLSINERKLLSQLVNAKGSIITFRELEYLIWPDSPVSDSALRTLIYRLRSKLEYRIIETVPSLGCKLTPLF
ncbi:response regulator [Halarcobacter anaerophilus]|uniref:DNA-binding response regulator n=1 Tax=Halarcobacter anaerophilus TaxID=877500 RepID=A0A4Q0XX78_9BACT|nr:response regulator [Halarcobacter anaerophilus]QDF30175.1 two-component system response regulator [Halarcobacter anaerophilus]RXJ62260.1 DNA-binding response regulator [Halarcobacter anaerophilus]